MVSIHFVRAEWPPRREVTFRARALLAAKRVLLWPVRVARGRRELSRLAALSDHQLRDIGLMRHDLYAARALPLDEDPTRLLAELVDERRRARPIAARRRG